MNNTLRQVGVYLAVCALLCGTTVLGAEPTTQPSQRVQTLKANLNAFQVTLHYCGANARERSLTLRTIPVNDIRQPDWPAMDITQEEATQIIAYLAERGWIDAAMNTTLKDIKLPTGPVYVLSLNVPKLELLGAIGFDKSTVDLIAGLRGLVGPEAAQAIDLQLKEAPIPTTQPARAE